MSRSTANYSKGMIFNILFIFLGVTVLLWLSTLDGVSIQEKISYYSSVTGQVAVIAIFVAPLAYIAPYAMSEGSTTKGLLYRIAIMIALQVVVLAFAPTIVEYFQLGGSAIESIILNAKGI